MNLKKVAKELDEYFGEGFAAANPTAVIMAAGLLSIERQLIDIETAIQDAAGITHTIL